MIIVIVLMIIIIWIVVIITVDRLDGIDTQVAICFRSIVPIIEEAQDVDIVIIMIIIHHHHDYTENACGMATIGLHNDDHFECHQLSEHQQ